jgi:NAD(P)-dependent dehydrogenase (short-subunit alcohol dehydrogenase family)
VTDPDGAAFDLAGRVAVVTGASRGVGREIARALDKAGVIVVGVARSETAIGRSYPTDLTHAAEVDRLVDRVHTEVGPVTILINAAGAYGPIHPVVGSDPAAWIETLSINLVASYLTCRAFVPDMLASGWGRVVNITSAAALHPPGPLNSAYATSKVALNQFTRTLAAELSGTGVTANVLHPGDLKTEMWQDIGRQLAELGPEAEQFRHWVSWVEETGGDPIEKAGTATLRIVTGGSNGEFHWIDDPLQAPVPSWPTGPEVRPWEG